MSEYLRQIFVQRKILKNLSKDFKKETSTFFRYQELVKRIKKEIADSPGPKLNKMKARIHQKLNSKFVSVTLGGDGRYLIIPKRKSKHIYIDGLKFCNGLSMSASPYISFRKIQSYMFDIELVERGEIYSIYKCFILDRSGRRVNGFVAYTHGERQFWGFSTRLKQLRKLAKDSINEYIVRKFS